MEFHLTQVEATLGADVCAGQHDVLAVTMPSPVVGDIKPTQFSVLVCPLELDNDEDYGGVSYWPPNFDQCETVVPACARLQLADEPQERRTVLLFGQFVQFEDQVAVWALADFTIDEVTFLIDGEQVSEYGSYTSGQGIGAVWPQSQDEPVLGYGEGPFLADITLRNLSAPLTTSAADPRSCEALHPSATHAVRLLFASAVHERAADSSLAPFGTNATAATALFSVHTGSGGNAPSPDRVVGVAGVPGGSVVDVCVEAAGPEPQVEAVVINCTVGGPLSPAGNPCDTPIKAFLRTWADERARRDPAAFAAGRTIEICLSAPENCPGAAPGPASSEQDDGDVVDAGDSSTSRAARGSLGKGLAAFAAAWALAVVSTSTAAM